MVRKHTSSKSAKTTNITPKVLAWSSHGEGQEIMERLSITASFFVIVGASDVFTEAEIATLTDNSCEAAALAWFGHTHKHLNKYDALEIALKYYATKILDLLKSMPEERAEVAADFIEADGHFGFKNREPLAEEIAQMD